MVIFRNQKGSSRKRVWETVVYMVMFAVLFCDAFFVVQYPISGLGRFNVEVSRLWTNRHTRAHTHTHTLELP